MMKMLLILQICRGLAYIHRVVGVCHRDIKPQNLLVSASLHSCLSLKRYHRKACSGFVYKDVLNLK